jgi:hypothetical protein
LLRDLAGGTRIMGQAENRQAELLDVLASGEP